MPLGGVCRNYRPTPATPESDLKRISLTGGLYACVDAADYEWLSQYHWRIYSGGYAARCGKGKMILMHREIMKPPKGMVVHHVDANEGNNCRFNLRVCAPAENRRSHTRRIDSAPRFKGVGYRKDLDKYRARMHFNGQARWLGLFDDEVEAARAYDHKAVECSGPFARVNLPEEWSPERRQRVYTEHTKSNGKRTSVKESSWVCSRPGASHLHSRTAGSRRCLTTRPPPFSSTPAVMLTSFLTTLVIHVSCEK